jgi:hypothetical protein
MEPEIDREERIEEKKQQIIRVKLPVIIANPDAHSSKNTKLENSPPEPENNELSQRYYKEKRC